MLLLDIKYTNAGFGLRIQREISEPIVGLFGPSGSGKSTLLNLISGFLTPDEGNIFLDQHCLFDPENKINVPPHLRQIGLVFQDGRLFPHLNVKDNLAYGGFRLIKSSDILEFNDVVDLLEIKSLLSKYPNQLSGGEVQRVALGRALLMAPRLLLLDEPLSSLDAALKQQILPFLKRIKDNIQIPMIYVSHDLAEIEYLTSTVIKIDKGTMV